jgi:hypothetical protein
MATFTHVPARLFLLCSTVIAAAVMELIDTSIVNVSLSHMSCLACYYLHYAAERSGGVGNQRAPVVGVDHGVSHREPAGAEEPALGRVGGAHVCDRYGPVHVGIPDAGVCPAPAAFPSARHGPAVGAIQAIVVLMLTARALQGGVPIPAIVLLGFVLFAFFSWKMAHLSGTSGKNDFYFPLILRGAGLALLTVPLTALAVSAIPLKDIAQGSALNNMMRQLGGSFGIALVNT